MVKPALRATQRLALLESVFREGASVAAACRDFGVSRFTFYKWAKSYNPKASRRQNLRNLRSKIRKIKRFAGQVSKDIEGEVKKIAAQKPVLVNTKSQTNLRRDWGQELCFNFRINSSRMALTRNIGLS